MLKPSPIVDQVLTPDIMISRMMQLHGEERISKECDTIRTKYTRLLQQYNDLPLTLPIDDRYVQRLCELLTKLGFETVESCEGHGHSLPKIWFRCNSETLLRDLSHVIERGSHCTTFRWQIHIWSSTPRLNPRSGLRFILSPCEVQINGNKKTILDPKDYFTELMMDLDILGISLLEYLEEEIPKFSLDTWSPDQAEFAP